MVSEVLSAGKTINDTIRYYCTHNKYRLLSFDGKINIDEGMKHLYDYAIKSTIFNTSTNSNEVHIFCGKKAKFFGFYLLSVIRVS